jgi:GT2 family glycosyltransferase
LVGSNSRNAKNATKAAMKSIPTLIIPVLNRYDLLDQLLDSINYPIDNIFIVDNGGEYSLPQKYGHLNIKLMNMPCNVGVAASWNLGIKCYPHSEYWVFSAIDTIILLDTLEKTAKECTKENLTISNYGFSYFAVGSEIIKKIGLFDENYYPAYYEDFDFEKRVRDSGYTNNVVYPDINIKLYDITITVKSNPIFLKGKQITDISNKKYLDKKFAGFNWNCYNWELQRRIENDWNQYENSV